MTKRDAFLKIRQYVNNDEELTAFVDKELALLDKRAATIIKAKKEKTDINNSLKEMIREALITRNEAMSTSDIAATLGVSTQKATPLLSDLVAEKIIVVNIDKKRKKMYTLSE